MTDDKLRQNAAAMLAFADKKTIQFSRLLNEKYTKEWADLENDGDGSVSWRFDMFEYRVKPEPVSRPWSKPEDVPPICWIRRIGADTQSLVLQMDTTGLCAGYSMVTSSRQLILWHSIDYYEHSTDRKTWHKCEVVE